MADSLVVGGLIELLGGGVPSQQPGAAGAIFRLGQSYDLSAPQMSSEQVAGLLLDGEQVVNVRASNRTPRLPIVIIVPPTGNSITDRRTLAAARELLLQTTAEDRWQLVWTRDGGLPLTWDCMGLSSVTIESNVIHDRNLCALLEVTLAALPYGRSDTEEFLVFPAPSQIWDTPPSSVTLDAFGTPLNFLSWGNPPPGLPADGSTFEGGIADWVAAGNCAIARSTAQFRTGAASLLLTASAAGAMQAQSEAAANIASTGTPPPGAMAVNPGQVVNVNGYSRGATVARSTNIGGTFYDGTGALLSTLRGSNVTNTTTGWTQATAAVTAPSLAAWVVASPQVLAAAGAGEGHYWDDIWMDGGAVNSADDPSSWSASALTAIAGQASAKWTRRLHDSPIYDRTLPAALDITGRTKLTFWLGLGTTATGYSSWHKGLATVKVSLYDAAGNLCPVGSLRTTVQASALVAKPHWQLMTSHIPQDIPGFDYTTVARYVVQVWNLWDGTSRQPALQASAYLCSVVAAPNSTGTNAARGTWYTLPGIVGTARSPLGVQLAPGSTTISSVADFTTSGTKTWVAPTAPAVSSIDKVETWGAGGGGPGSFTGSPPNPGSGAGAGGYAMRRNVPVTPGGTYHPIVGAKGVHGTAGSGTNTATTGGDSTFVGDSGVTTTGNGGQMGYRQTTVGGHGGQGVGDLVHPGGDGFPASIRSVNDGGGGGGSGGTGADGPDAPSRYPAAPVQDGGKGGQGGGGLAGQHDANSPGTWPGGGGAGAGYGGTQAPLGGAGTDGADGRVRLTYGATGLVPMGSALLHMPGRTAPPSLSPLLSVGAGADVPNGSIDYTFPAIGAVPARFDGTYTLYLVASSWNTPANARTLTLTVKQYAYAGGPVLTQALVRSVTPSTDIVNGWVEMGTLTLPLADLAPGNSDAYFAASVTSSNTADRFWDCLACDTQGQTVLANMTGTAWANNLWVDVAELDRDLGRVLGSDADRDRARSVLPYCDPASTRISGGPLAVYPMAQNRLLVYCPGGNPGVSAHYFPHWWQDRLS